MDILNLTPNPYTSKILSFSIFKSIKKSVIVFALMIIALSGQTQINYSEGFGGCNGNPCNDWSWDVPGGSMTAIAVLGYSPCEVADPAARVQLNGAVTTAVLTPLNSLGSSSGEFANFGFKYKVTNFLSGTPASANSATFTVESAITPAGPWTFVETFQNISASNCEDFTSIKFFPAIAQPTYVRISVTRNSGDIWAVIDDIELTQPAPSVVESTDCICNDDQTPNNVDGTYSTTLTIRYADNGAMESGLNYTLTSSTGLSNSSGGPIGTPSFIQCTGGCPTGVTLGTYYLPVQVQPGGMYSAMVDGPDPDSSPDHSLGNTTCATLYPALPSIPFNAINCLDAGLNTFNTNADVVFSMNNTVVNPTLPDGFEQTGPQQITIDNDVFREVDNQPDGIDMYLIRSSGGGCTVSSFINMEVYNEVSATLIDVSFECRKFKVNDTVFLTALLDPTNSGEGEFIVNGMTIEGGRFGVDSDICVDVTYEVTDQCGVLKTDTKKLLVTYRPKASFDFRSDPGDPVSPKCSASPVDVTLVRNSTAPNFEYILSSDNASYTPTLSGNVLTLPNPNSVNELIEYTVCLAESSNAAPTCAPLTAPICRDTLCKTFTVYRDKSDCGANAIFTSTCDIYMPDLCVASASPGIEIGCLFFQFETPAILTSDVTMDAFAECDTETISGSYNISFFGIDAEFGGGGKTIGSFPGISVVCDILNFKILGWRPLGGLYNILGCDKTIAQFIFGAISALAGGDGGGGIVMADTDGDGGFDYLIKESIGTFPVSGNFTIPNNLNGPGQISVRAVGGWVNSPKNMCGNFDVEGVNVLDLLPIGAIPIVGSVIEDILAAASCGVNIAISSEETKTVLVGNNEVPIFANCNPDGYTFAQTLDCDLPVNWSIPVAHDGCSQMELVYRGITDMVDVSNYPGTPPTPVMTDQPGIYQTSGPMIGSILTPGVYPVTYLAVSCNGLPELCTFNATVTSGDPILEAPNSQAINAAAGSCDAIVNGLAPYQGIGCSSIINYSYTSPVTNTLVQTNSTLIGTHNIPDGNSFELGVTVITYTMLVDINGDGDYDDPQETQVQDFSINVVDDQNPHAVCLDVHIQLDNTGSGTVYARERTDEVYIDGGSTDNCAIDSVLISSDNSEFLDSLDFDCSNKGQNVINMKIVDESGNESFCKAVVTVIDFFEGYVLDLDVPEICFEPFQDSIDFSPYIVIAQPSGTNVSHANVSTIGPEVYGTFGISAFLPDPGSSNDPGTITNDGVYTLGTGTGYITISYILAIEEQVNQINDTTDLTGCFRMVHDVFRVEKLDPVWEGGFICCDQSPVFLGGAFWDGSGMPPLPAGLISLTDIRGSYPGDVDGDWTGDGVSFINPDGVPFSGDEYFQFDPMGFDQSITLTYTIGDEPCIFDYSQEILVTCQDLQIALSDTTVCPATAIDERVVIVNLDDDDLVVTTTGIAAAGGVDLTDEPVIDGRVVIPGFTTIAVRDEVFTITVTVYQTTDFGCADFFTYNIHVLDTIAPLFQNCPKEPIVVEALPGICENFVNFEDPWADDNCFSLYSDIEQVDLTGLVSGDLYPVGLTVLAYTATDTVGNQSYCELKIVVNDYEQDPMIVCADDVEAVNDPGNCSAVIDSVSPVLLEDNCLTNNTVTYEVMDKDGLIIHCGFEDASGEEFPVGKNVVTYYMYDQPLVLITEIVQDGLITGVEVTNFGPASIDLTCAKFSIKDANGMVIDTFLVPTRNNKSTEEMQVDFPPLPVLWVLPNPNIIPVGGTFTHEFDNGVAFGDETSYCFSFLERLIDEVTINDQVTGAVILRKNVCDHDEQMDFIPATPCDPGSFGMLNPGLPLMIDNGTQTALQNFAPNSDTCSFIVEVADIEAPRCIMHDSIALNANLTVPLPIGGNLCTTSDITMPAGIVNDVNIKDLLITIPDAGTITAYLNSPSGTRIRLFDGLCNGTPNVDVTLDQTDGLVEAPSITTAPCGPLGGGGVYKPEESLKAFFGEPSGGIWQLEVFTSDIALGTIDNWELEVLNEELYGQQDTTLTNDTLLCSAEFTWTHPVFRDNCCEGSMSVEYAFSNAVTGVTSIENGVIQTLDGSVNIDGTLITRIFPVGITVITYTLIDQYGNQSQCSFIVTVLDEEDPMFPDGCQNWQFSLDGGECYGSLPIIPEVTDNCALDTITFCDANGDPIDIHRLPIGLNMITIKGIDIYGNIGTCDFTVEIIEYVPANYDLNCNNAINLSLGPDCMAIITADMILEGNDYRCYENYCINITTEGGVPHDSIFTLVDVGKTFIVTITDCLNSPANSCWGYVNIEEKLIPQIECPKDVILLCNEDPSLRDISGRLITGELELLSCEPSALISYQDHLDDNGQCTDPRATIVRKWKVEDNAGNVVSCDQLITFLPINTPDIQWPMDFVGLDAISCSDVKSNGDVTKPESTGFPSLNNSTLFGNNYCDIKIGYWDEFLEDVNCSSGYTLLRNWTVLNECLPIDPFTNPIRHIQRIDIDDIFAPTLYPVADVTVGTDPWTCRGAYKLPEIVHEDDCSGYRIEWYSSYGQFNDSMIYNLLKGVTDVTAFVFDDCGNFAQKSFKITTLDKTAPITVSKGDIVVSLSTFNGSEATAKEYVESFDNGSFDNCSDVHIELRRIDDVPCNNIGLNGHNNNSTFDNTSHPDDSVDDTDDGEYVKFCCEDMLAITYDANEDGMIDSLDRGYVKVVMRVWDDGNMSGIYGDIVNGHTDNYNETWSSVKVECKSIPIIVCPPPLTVKCYWDVSFDPAAGWRKVADVDLSKSGFGTAQGCCGDVEVEFSDAGNLTECEEGTFVRTFRAGYTSIDGKQSYVQCQQQITVLRDNYPVTITPKNRLFNNPSCSFNTALVDQMRPTVVGGPCDVIGENISVDTFLFENGVCKKWKVTFEYWNWCLNEDLGTFVEYAVYEDTDDPVIMNCLDTCIGVDVNCEAVLVLTNAAFDTSACTDMEWIKWICEVDLWADGTIDYVAATHFTQNNWTGFGQGEDPWYTNAHSKIHIDATASKDSEDQPMDMLSADQIVTVTIPEAIVGKMSNHKVTWKAIDGCHNESGCQMNVMVADKKAPTPYCVNISSAVMADGSVELWARDFDKNSFDNCTDQEDLYFTFYEMRGPLKDTIIRVSNRDYTVNADIPYFFDEDGFVGFDGDGVVTDVNGNIIPAASTGNIAKYIDGNIQRWKPSNHSSSKIFDCDEYAAQGPQGVPVNMSVWDKKCNTDFCVVFITLVDNQDGCSGNRYTISGIVANEQGELVKDVVMTLESDINDFTRIQTTDNGLFVFNNIPANRDYTIFGSKDYDYMNGISTLDLVLIQRHILQLQELPTEYRLVAADVNDDLKIRTNDLVELRKMILGITNEFTAPSWRIIDAKIPVPMQIPLDFSTTGYIPNLQGDYTTADFIATKMGDVSGDAITNFKSSNADSRSNYDLILDIDEASYLAGESFTLDITSSNFENVFGMQFSASIEGLIFDGVIEGSININEASFGLPSAQTLTCSWAAVEATSRSKDDVLFTLRFTAERNISLSKVLEIHSKVTKSESYIGSEMELGSVSLNVRGELNEAENYALYQNEPNPFKDATTIAYELPQNAKCVFTIYDVTGKVLLTRIVQGERGLNNLEINANDLSTSGIIYYQIESGTYTSTRKMLVIE